jgi:hypothetical protein
MAPKCKSSDAGSASKPKRSHDVLTICEKVKILDMMETEKHSYLEIARLYGKYESFIREVMKSNKKISLLYRFLRIRLKRQNFLFSYMRERDYNVNVVFFNAAAKVS